MSALIKFDRSNPHIFTSQELRVPPFALNPISTRTSPSALERAQRVLASAAIYARVNLRCGSSYASALLGAGMLFSATVATAATGIGGAGAVNGGAGGNGGGFSGALNGNGNAPADGNGGDGLWGAAKGGQVGQTISGDIVVNSAVAGGNGDAAISGNATQFNGGSGGGGGTGIFASSAATVTVDAGAQVSGGDGGAGGAGRPGSSGSIGGGGGGGGHGINFTDGGTLVNAGVIQGGNGGTGNDRWGTMQSVNGGGGGGAAVIGANVNIINSGTISAGVGGLGGVANVAAGNGQDGAAINWTGGSNRLQLDAGSVINGAVWVQSGALAEIVANAEDLVMTNSFLFDGAAALDTQGHTLTVEGIISGAADIAKTGEGTLILSGANDHSGTMTVFAGTLAAGAANTLSANANYVMQAGTNLELNGHDQTIAGMNNSGLVSLVGDMPGTTLTVTGNWHGVGGVLRLGVALGDSDSIADRLVLDGASASATGRTRIEVINLDGLGAKTQGDGIEIVSAINGATTTAGAFRLVGGHVDAGAFEYRLYAGDAKRQGESWYLRSTLANSEPAYRRETLLFGALPEQLRQANLAMLGTASQRTGSNPALQLASGERQAWSRVISAQRTISQGGPVSPTSEGRFNGFQIGTDLWAKGDWRAGAYIGHLDGDMSVSGAYGGSSDKHAGASDSKNQYIAGYGSWKDDGGAYAEVVLQQGLHRYSVKPTGNAPSKSKGRSAAASVEAGKAFAVATKWQVEPQVQLTAQHLDLDDARISGADVRLDTPMSWLGRAGVRFSVEPTDAIGVVQPFAQVNLYKGSGSADVGQYIGPAGSAKLKTSGAHSGAELALGASMKVSPSYSIFGELNQRSAFDEKTQIKGAIGGSVGVSISW